MESRNTTTKKFIAELTEADIRKACFILDLLEGLSYEKIADFHRRESYINKVQTIQADIRHIKEML